MHTSLKPARRLPPALKELKGYIKYWDLSLMLLPVIAYFIIFKYVPMSGIVIAFKDYKISEGVSKSQWVGLANYLSAFGTNSRFFVRAMRNTIIISALKLAVGFPAPILLAILLNEVRHTAYKRVVQTVSYLPHFLSWVIMAGILTQLLSPNSGAVNALLKDWFGLKEPIKFLLSDKYFRGTVVVSDVWKGVGWGSILYLATITIMLILNLGSILDAGFDQIFNLYSSAVYETGDIIDTYVYRMGIEGLKYDLSTAIGLFKNIIGFILVLSTNFIAKRISGNGIW